MTRNVENWDNSLRTQQARFACLLRASFEKLYFSLIKWQQILINCYRASYQKFFLTLINATQALNPVSVPKPLSNE